MDKLNDKALLPCPFCGGPVEIYKTWVPYSRERIACCADPSCLGFQAEHDEQGGWAASSMSDAEAIAAWNHRAPAAISDADGLEVVAWAQDALRKLAGRSPTVMEPGEFEDATTALVRLSDAQTALQSQAETIAKWRERFFQMDANFDRAVSRAEAAEARLSRAAEVVRLAEAELTKLYAAIAPHSDGRAAAGSEAVRAAREFMEGGE